MDRYQKMTDLLRTVLSKEQFLELQELLDNDKEGLLSELISSEAALLAPEDFQPSPGKE